MEARRVFFSELAYVFGLILDGSMKLVALWPGSGLPARFIYYVLGMLVCAAGIALLFNTYIAPEAYELFVKEFSAKYDQLISKVKTIYDCISCAAGIPLSYPCKDS